jgi:hypothetical protein
MLYAILDKPNLVTRITIIKINVINNNTSKKNSNQIYVGTSKYRIRQIIVLRRTNRVKMMRPSHPIMRDVY